LGIILENGKPS